MFSTLQKAALQATADAKAAAHAQATDAAAKAKEQAAAQASAHPLKVVNLNPSSLFQTK